MKRIRAGWMVVVAATLAVAVSPVLGGTPEGSWKGEIKIPGSPLAVEVHLAVNQGVWSGAITIPAQQLRGLVLESVTVEESSVSFVIPGIPGDPGYRGDLGEAGDVIAGTFSQGGYTFRLDLTRDTTGDATLAALDGFEKFVEEAMTTFQVPGAAVAIVKDDRVLLARGFGFRDLEAKEPVTADTLFAIGSATKAFTSFLLATLVDEGVMAWDTPVRRYLPWFALADSSMSERLTPRDLVTHRSGLPRHDLVWYNNLTASREELVRRLAHLPASADLRERYQYNNMMFLTAGVLAESLTCATWEEAVRARILDPLGMTSTNFSVVDSQAAADHALPYRERDGKVERIPFRDISTVGPAGSINSTANDMTRWLRMQLGGGRFEGRTVVERAVLAETHRPHMVTEGTPERADISPATYGLGWFTDTYRGHARIHHGGAIDGFLTMVSMLPRDGIGMVVMVNMNGSPLPELLVRSAFDRLLGLEPVDWVGDAASRRERAREADREAREKGDTFRRTGTRPARGLADYAGTYHHPGYGEVVVRTAGRGLEVEYNGIVAPLEHWHFEVFNGVRGGADETLADIKFQFRDDVRGNVAAVAAALEPAVDEVVFRRRPDAWMSDPKALERLTGTYQLPTVAVRVALRGTALTLFIPGQPVRELVPMLGEEFAVKGATVARVRFDEDARTGEVSLVLDQPGRVYTAPRTK